MDTVYEREEQKYVAEEKDFTQPQFFVAEEVKYFTLYTIHCYLAYSTIIEIFFNFILFILVNCNISIIRLKTLVS